MKIKKTTITYHNEKYYGVIISLEKGEETLETKAGEKMLFADIQLWFDIVGDDTLKSDREDTPQDHEGELIDQKVYYYDLNVLLYSEGNMTDEDFKKWALDCID